MKLVIIFGPQAAGKMTVGHELEAITDLKLFHNHMTIELVHPFFDFGTPAFERLVTLFREKMFEEVAGSDLYGIIFTYVWAFNSPSDWAFIEKTKSTFEAAGGEVYFVELQATLDERLRRNVTPHRLAHKPTKRNVQRSEENLKLSMKTHRLYSHDGEITHNRYLKIDNTHLSAAETAMRIKQTFDL
ncbi:AAA family ATPase [Ectobacillus antri]|uniref:AAA family ATPase n=1 Tax=Ectobacillus antri TaxID=2486280 RepID=A0ABT6H935_9BACI|nr:AAA family ATPase [Ectobacillus antri]MDG4657211.1 AAA family ATPase [Ectobacillus antri]MDG5755224.1 AAA family ATPase [Ectobacillus antri]